MEGFQGVGGGWSSSGSGSCGGNRAGCVMAAVVAGAAGRGQLPAVARDVTSMEVQAVSCRDFAGATFCRSKEVKQQAAWPTLADSLVPTQAQG